MALTYDKVFPMWKFLFEDVACANDMTGAYCDQEDLESLIKDPSKKNATNIMKKQIEYWFSHGIEYSMKYNRSMNIFDFIAIFPKIDDIAYEFDIDYDDCPNPFMAKK